MTIKTIYQYKEQNSSMSVAELLTEISRLADKSIAFKTVLSYLYRMFSMYADKMSYRAR